MSGYGGELVNGVSVGGGEEDFDEADEGGVSGVTAFLNQMVIEGKVVVVLGGEDAGVVGGEGLDDDFSGADSSAGSPGDLGEELEGSF